MFARTAITLTLLFFAGAAVAEWQSKPQAAAAPSNRLQETSQQAASGLVQASLTQRTNSVEPADAKYVPRPEVEALIREGNKRMREGDILGARQSYQKAVAFGDAAAALVMGRSYDPIYFAKIAGRNAEPEPAKALEWYGRAMDAGAVQTAMVRIGDLKRFVSR
jgi:TPR repeat protein